jgi:acetyl/propionyl-CoA carboxylase alpha subunit
MLDVSALLDELKASPYEEMSVCAPVSGVISFASVKEGDKVAGPGGAWGESPGTHLATVVRERNPRLITAGQKGMIVGIRREFEGKFVEAGTALLVLRHFLSREEALRIILRHALHLFHAPERAKYYFTPAVDLKVKVSGSTSVTVSNGMELFIMSRMKRESSVCYSGPEGVIYAVYFKHNTNMDAGEPLIGVFPQSELGNVEKVVLRVQNEWKEQD